jgi:hypothetical protein
MRKIVYLINGDHKYLLHHYIDSEEAPKLIKGTHKEEINSVPSYTLTVGCENPCFNLFYPKISHIQVLNELGIEEFYGRLISPVSQMNTTISKTFIFEGVMGYLNDVTIRPKEYHDYNVRDFINDILNQYNDKVEDYKKIYPGYITVDETVYRMSNYEDALSLLFDRLPNRLGGFLRVRRLNGTNFLDYTIDMGEETEKTIKFGENMLSYKNNPDFTNIATVLIPLGATIEATTQESPVGNRITIESVNDGKDYIENTEAIKVFGRNETICTWDDVHEPSILLEKAKEKLKELSLITDSVELTFAEIEDNTPLEFYLGDTVRVINPCFEVDTYYRIVSKTLDLYDDPTKNKYTFGSRVNNLTDKQIIINNSQKKLQSFFNEYGLNANFLEGTINLLKNQLKATVDKAENQKDYSILFECTDRENKDFYGAMALGTKGFMIAEEKEDPSNQNSPWLWRTFGTGKGFVADYLIAGTISTCLIKSIDGSIDIDLNKGTFKIGATNGSNCAIHTNSFSRWQHNKDGYTEANANGFYRNGREYLTNISVGSGIVGGSAGVYPSTVTIQLPESFKGHSFAVVVNTVDTAGGLADEYMKRIYLQAHNYNYANATFQVTGYWTAINSVGAENQKELTFSYTAIGG